MFGKDPGSVEGQSSLNSILGQGCKVKGNIELQGTIRIDGDFDGQVNCPETLIIGKSGVVKAEVLTSEDTSSVYRALGTELSFEEMANLLRRGYEAQFDLSLVPRQLNALEMQAIEALAVREFGVEQWLRRRRRRLDLDEHVSAWAQLGVFEASFSLRQERFIREIQFAGDFIANFAAVDTLERKLRLCPLDWRAVDAVVRDVFADPRNYLLGVGKLGAIADLLARSSRS